MRALVQHHTGRPQELFAWFSVCFSGYAGGDTGARALGMSDEQLVVRWQQGDRQAFEALVRRYQNLAYTVCRRYLVNPEVAEETAQDVFVSLFRKLHKFRGEASFKSWFYKVLINHCHNRHKAGVRRRQHLHESIDGPKNPENERSRPRELVDEGPDPENALTERERQQLIEHALEAIGAEGRMVLLLREGQGLTYEEIAETLELPVGTVKSRIHRARAELKVQVARLSRPGSG